MPPNSRISYLLICFSVYILQLDPDHPFQQCDTLVGIEERGRDSCECGRVQETAASEEVTEWKRASVSPTDANRSARDSFNR